MDLIRGDYIHMNLIRVELNSYEFKSVSEFYFSKTLNSFNSFKSFNSWRKGEGHVPQELISKSDFNSYEFNSGGIKFI